MGKEKKKGQSGIAVTYINRNQSLKKLQLSLSDFRQLCILKGIYPHEPKHRNKLDRGKNIQQPQTYYLLKDIQYLSHEPLIEKFRDTKVFIHKLKKSLAKKDYATAEKLRNHQPQIKLDHIVKERYPNFIDAVRDLDDCLTLCALFSRLPKSKKLKTDTILLCRRLMVEFMNYVINTQALRKVFLSIKGIYYQVEIMGQTITWITPYEFPITNNAEVDFKIMSTFVRFYTYMLGFVNYKLYVDNNYVYPPKLTRAHPTNSIDDEIGMYTQLDSGVERLGSFTESIQTIDNEKIDMDMDVIALCADNPEEIEREKIAYMEEYKKLQDLKNLFKGLKIFLNREVPKESLTFVIRCFNGEVSWDPKGGIGSKYPETEETITHHIVDRPNPVMPYRNRFYLQPQWVYDCVNAGQILPVQPYFPGAELPPHLSPFVVEKEGDYIPPERLEGGQQTSALNEENVKDHSKALAVKTKKIKEPVKKKAKTISEDSAIESDGDKDGSENETEEKPKDKKKKKRSVEKGVMRAENALLKPKSATQSQTPMDEGKEEKKLREMMITKKYKRLYGKIRRSEQLKKKEVSTLKAKRARYEAQKAESK